MRTGPFLVAQDAEDLEILSARLQDAVAKVKDLVWLPRSHRFAALFNRFKWEDAESKGNDLRVQTCCNFENVLSARMRNVRTADPDAVLSLLAIQFTQNAAGDPGGTVELVFSGGGAVRLSVECIEVQLADVSAEWAARGKPSHTVEC